MLGTTTSDDFEFTSMDFSLLIDDMLKHIFHLPLRKQKEHVALALGCKDLRNLALPLSRNMNLGNVLHPSKPYL